MLVNILCIQLHFVCLNKVRRKQHFIHMVILHFSFSIRQQKKTMSRKSKNRILFNATERLTSVCVCDLSEILNIVVPSSRPSSFKTLQINSIRFNWFESNLCINPVEIHMLAMQTKKYKSRTCTSEMTKI